MGGKWEMRGVGDREGRGKEEGVKGEEVKMRGQRVKKGI